MPAETVPVPSVAVPSLKVTLPVGVAPVTDAVKVTEAPEIEGFELEVSAAVVADVLMDWTSTLDVDAALAESPEY